MGDSDKFTLLRVITLKHKLVMGLQNSIICTHHNLLTSIGHGHYFQFSMAINTIALALFLLLNLCTPLIILLG